MTEPAFTLLKLIHNGNTLPAGARLLIAVSGGADSMALLHLYTRVRAILRLEIAAATFDHGLRADAARDDVRFVEATAAAWGVKCYTGVVLQPVPDKGIETWARQRRYTFLAETARLFGATHIATAHHADDQAETVLANIVRGTGIRGLGGMRPVSPMPGAPDLALIRPLLSVTRADLVAYCHAEEISWREDASNSDTRYRRNWYRHTVIPLLRDVNPAVAVALARLASISVEQDDYFELVIKQLFREHASISEGWVWLPRNVFSIWHPAMQKRALIHAQKLIDSESELDFDRIQAAARLAVTEEGGIIELGRGAQVEIDSGWLAISKSGAEWSPPYPGFWMQYWDTNLGPRVMPASDASEGSVLMNIRMPHDSVINVRSRRDGDRVYPRALMGRSQKLKDWLINRKTPRLLRDHLPVIEVAEQIVAIWDGAEWVTFAPPFPDETIEVSLMHDAQLL